MHAQTLQAAFALFLRLGLGACQKPGHGINSHGLRQWSALARRIEHAGGVVGAQSLGIEELEELPEGGKAPACELALNPSSERWER